MTHNQNSDFQPTGDPFVDSCFVFDIIPEKESRIPSEIPRLKDVPGFVKNKEYKAAWNILEDYQDSCSDLDFIYIWQAFILQKQGRVENAGAVLSKGLKKAKQKHQLCDRMGLLAFETGHMEEAVKWWIRGIVLMHSSGSKMIWEPFLYLSSVAKACGNESLAGQLSEQVARICVQGELKFEADTEQAIREISETLPKASVIKALEILCGLFKKPVEKQETLGGIKNTPDSLSSDAGETAPEKKPILWICFIGLALSALILYLFLTLGLQSETKSPPVPEKEAAETPLPQKPETVSKPEAPPEENLPSNGEEKKEERITLESVKKPVSPPEEAPAPHKEKLRELKVKTKTVHPDILKKTE